MAKARFSSRMLDSLKEQYRYRIASSRDDEERVLKLKRTQVKESRQANMIAAIIKAARDAGAEMVSVADSDCYTDEVSIRIVCKHPMLSRTDPELMELDEKRRESCRKHKQMMNELNSWVIKCIENQEITPFEGAPEEKINEIV